MKMQIKIGDQDFEVEIEDIQARPVVALVNGEAIEIWPQQEEHFSHEAKSLQIEKPLPVTKSTAANQGGQSSNSLNAPLPGVIISIDVKVGDSIKQGQSVLTLEAMKMKNVIRSTRDGVISEIHVNTGDLVKHGQLLISFSA